MPKGKRKRDGEADAKDAGATTGADSKTDTDIESSDDPSTPAGKKRKTANEAAPELKVSRVPLRSLQPNHLLSKKEYLRVLSVDPAANKVRAQVLRGDKATDVWEIQTPDDLLACSTEYVQRTERVSKTELANRLAQCKDDVFKVVYRPVLSAEALAKRLKDLKAEVEAATTDSALKKVAKKLLEVEPKTLKGRLIKPIDILGYSLVDDLDQPDTQKVAFRNIGHQNILSITVAGVQYVLK